MQPEHLTHKSLTLFLDYLKNHRFFDSMMGSKPHAVLFSSPGLGHLITVFELGKHLVITHHNFQATIMLIASNTSPAESQVIQSAMSLNLYDIVQLPPRDISNLIDAETVVVSPTCTNDAWSQTSPSVCTLCHEAPSHNPYCWPFRYWIYAHSRWVWYAQVRLYRFECMVPCFVQLYVYTTILGKEVEGEFVDQTEPFRIPGCNLVRPPDIDGGTWFGRWIYWILLSHIGNS